MKLTTPNPINISMHIKKGNRAGQTTLNQRFKPSREALYVSSGKIIMLDIIKRNNKALKYRAKYFLIIASPKIENKIIYYINKKNNYTHYFMKGIGDDALMVKKPLIGLALGSGASRGLAHIGVLMALGENDVKPDYVAGCSIGALIGSLYLCGIDLDLLAKLAKNMKADMWMDPAVSRKGILAGKKAEEFFKILTKNRNIEELEKPINIVATDLVNSKRYIFNEGPLWRAIRASISIPGIFCPIEIDDMILVDGGVIERVPATLAKEMGSDIVIAVDVGKGQNSLKPKNFFEVIMKSIETMENTIIENKFSEDYIFINPIIKNINPLDFTKVDLCIEEGKRAALEALPKINKAIDDYFNSLRKKGDVL